MTNKLKTILLDDEEHALGNLENAIHEVDPSIEVCAKFTDPISAILYAQNNPIDIFFLDISMPQLSGFEVLEKMGTFLNFKTVFVTAFSEYAINAIKLHVFDYLLKPIDHSQLKNCLISSKLDLQNKTGKRRIIIQSLDKISFVNMSEICYLKSDNSYTKFVLENQTILSSKPISYFYTMLDSSIFFRCHNSFIIQKNKVVEYNKKKRSLVLKNEDLIPVARSKKDDLLKWLL